MTEGSSILVVGSVAFDDVRTPFGAGENLLGGSATHFSVAASYFAPVRLVAVVGEDFADPHAAALRERGVDLSGLQRRAGRTFRWAGEYDFDLNNPRTLDTQLNVFAEFTPELPPGWEDTPVVFLANIDPELQSRVRSMVREPRLVAADTMNFWIAGKPDALRQTLGAVDVLLINDGEVRQLTGRWNLVEAAEEIHALGPRTVVVKRGEHGVLVFAPGDVFAVPAYPLRRVLDPTGAGDAFAGGFLGHLAARLQRDQEPDWRRAAVVGSVMASFQVESFSLERVRRLRPGEIEERYAGFRKLTEFGDFQR
ncbi:MAG TPA: PfkB family carbohydrate kinase [Candidatus Polarisedimenticolaceae bacterium]|nr:PfkB family carbohydrate kinase [Candidatus Polarisedimenticolaceae bacterium]